MALKSTVFKAELQIADMDRGYYGTHAVTLAQHPSENDERLMVRLLAYALHAGAGEEPLSFANGMTQTDEPELWRRSLVGEVELWIDVGLPDEKWLRRASNRSEAVVLYTFGRNAPLWWTQQRGALERFANLRVRQLGAASTQALAALAQRSMRLQITVQDGHLWVADDRESVEVELVEVKEARER